MPRAAHLRLAADGELTEAQRSELGSLTEAESRAIETERALRQSVGRVMAAPAAAPLGLRDRILVMAESQADEIPAAMAEPKASGRAPASQAAAGEPDDVLDPIPIAPWMRPLAVAAAVLLMVAGGFMFLRGDGADVNGSFGGSGGSFASANGGGGSVQLVELRQFMSREHNRCERDPSRAARKFARAEISEIPDRYRSLMGGDVSIEEITKARLKLHGVGECHVPGPGSSIHLLLGAECKSTLSLFIKRDKDNPLQLEEGVSYELSPQDSGGVSIVAWRRDGLTYFLVADPDACGRIREAMGHLELSKL